MREFLINNFSYFLVHFEYFIRVIVAALLGVLIGFERKNRNKEAGIRTHSIVCLASALIMIVSKYGFEDLGKFDGSRIASQVISGIGFLGAGIIFVKNNAISGLTTAAGVWATAGIGLAMGAGMYLIAITGAVLIVVIQIIMHKDTFLSKEPLNVTYEVSIESSFETIRGLRKSLESIGLEVRNVEIVKRRSTVNVKFYTLMPVDFERQELEGPLFNDSRVKKIQL